LAPAITPERPVAQTLNSRHKQAMQIDLHRLVAMLEELFGPRAGRRVAIGLATLACVAAASFLLWVTWAYAAKYLLEFLLGLLTQAVSLNDVSAAVLTLIWAMIVYGAVLVGILYFFGRALLKKAVSQSALDGLARLRNQAISELYSTGPLADEAAFVEWNRKYDEWLKNLLAHVKQNFPEADFLSIEFIGVVPPMKFPWRFSPAHNRLLSHLVRRFEILEGMLASYRR
jgi:hypothetical protein